MSRRLFWELLQRGTLRQHFNTGRFIGHIEVYCYTATENKYEIEVQYEENIYRQNI